MTELLGHRGYSARYPENTLLSFKKAIEVGCSGIELDVRLTKDNKVVVIHDKNLERTTTGKGLVSKYTLKELKKLDAGRGEKIPRLEEVLEEIKKAKLLIELKEYSERICSETVKLAGKRKNTFFISFSIEAIQNIKRINPKLKTGLIFSKPLAGPEQYLRFITAREYLPDFIGGDESASNSSRNKILRGLPREYFINALCPRVDRLDSKIAGFAKQYGFDIYVWTVDTASELKKVLQYGVTGVVSNDPGEIGGWLCKEGKREKGENGKRRIRKTN